MKLQRRFDGDRWTWCAVTRRGEVLAEFTSHDDAAAWMRQYVGTARKSETATGQSER